MLSSHQPPPSYSDEADNNIEVKESPSNENLLADLYDVTLHRTQGEALGFNVVGGIDSEHLPGIPSPFISAVRSNSEAAAHGIRPGDRIVKINGIDVSNKTHEEIVNILSVGNIIRITLEPNAEERLLASPVASPRGFVLPPFVQRAFQSPVNGHKNNNIESEGMDIRLKTSEDMVDISPDTPVGKKRLEEKFERNVPESVYKRSGNAIFFGIGVAVGVLSILTFVHGRQFFGTVKGKIAAFFIKSAVQP